MIQVLEENKKPKFLESLLSGLAAGAPGALDAYLEVQEKNKKESLLDKENQELEKQGYNLKNVRSSDARKALLDEQSQTKKNQVLRKLLDESYEQSQEFNPPFKIGQGPNKENGSSQFSDEKIDEISLLNPQYGNMLRQRKNDSVKREFEEKKSNAKAKSDLEKENRKVKREDAKAAIRKNEKTETESKKLSPFQQVSQQEAAKATFKAHENIASLDSNLKNLDELDKEVKNVTGTATGYLKTIFKPESASKFNSLGISAVQPLLPIFNPRGTASLEKMIIEKFSPQAGDRAGTIQGKIKALRSLYSIAKQREQDKITLFEQYKGSPPTPELIKFDKDSEDIAKQLSSQTEKEEEPELVSGYRSVQTGKKLKSLPKKQIDELIKKGLITNEPE